MSPERPRCAQLLFALAMLLVPIAPSARAQSGDVNYPTPIFSNEVTGRIAPRDIGDPRRTRHFYTFRGAEGDITVTLESTELRGDVDLFTAGTLRPLLKITIYGGPTVATKSVYLRREETLVLRVEARAEGETEGSYRIRLGGSFAPAPAELAEAPPPALPEAVGGGPGVRRVTSTGARIEEPAPPATEARTEPTPEPTPAEAAAETAAPRPTPRRDTSRAGTRRSRGAATTSRRRAGTPSPPAEAAREGEAAEREEPNPLPTDSLANESAPPPTTARRTRPSTRRSPARTTRRTPPREPAESSPETSPAEPTPTPAPEAPGQRLVIVTKDGETIERDMRTVRRVTVENNQIVVVTRDGKVLRQPLSNVSRMAIEP